MTETQEHVKIDIEEPSQPLHEKAGQPTCAICLSAVETTGRYILGCSHTFHPSCAITWLSKKDECPVCRRPTGDFNSPLTPESSRQQQATLQAATSQQLVLAQQAAQQEEEFSCWGLTCYLYSYLTGAYCLGLMATGITLASFQLPFPTDIMFIILSVTNILYTYFMCVKNSRLMRI